MIKENKIPDKSTIINELARRRGFFWQSYEIYGGVSGFVSFGHLGAKLKQNIENKLRQLFLNDLNIIEVESPIITPSRVFEASGHIQNFKEPMVECQNCRRRFRADHLLREQAGMSDAEAEKLSLDKIGEALAKNDVKCPECGSKFGEPRQFLTMFKTTIGPYEGEGAVGYGRPEAAQGMFVEFNRLYTLAREKLPFGAIQIGHVLRNEISPRQGLIRLREFTICDLEFFFDPKEPRCQLLDVVGDEKLNLLLADTKLQGSEKTIEATINEALENGYIKCEWQAVFMAFAKRLLVELGVPAEKQRFIEKLPWERAHYSIQSFDQEVKVERWGWVEVSGHAYRTDYDLKSHMEASGIDLRVYKEYAEPIEKEQLKMKPVMAKIGSTFKGDAGRIVEMLSKEDPQEVARALKETGHYKLDKYEIPADHVSIIRAKISEKGEKFLPHVVEPSFGSDRLLYVTLEYAYRTKEGRALLSFPRDVAPVQIGVYPLVSKDGLPEKAIELCKMLANEGFRADFDEAGSIGRRYARADEIGAPLGITVDYETMKDDTVTIRDRDSWRQVRTSIAGLARLLHDYFSKKVDFNDLGGSVSS